MQTVAAAAAAVTGQAPSVTCCPGVPRDRRLQPARHPGRRLRPGLIERMHTPDENVPVANLVAAARVYTKVAAALT